MINIQSWTVSSAWHYIRDYEEGQMLERNCHAGAGYDPAHSMRLMIIGALGSIIRRAVWRYTPEFVTFTAVLHDIDLDQVRRELEQMFDKEALDDVFSDVWLKLLVFNFIGVLVVKRKKIRRNQSLDEMNDEYEILDDQFAIIGGTPCYNLNRSYRGFVIYDNINAISSFIYLWYYRYRYPDRPDYWRMNYTSGYCAVTPEGYVLTDWTLAGIKERIKTYRLNG